MIARKLSACMLVALLSTAAFAFVSFGSRADQGGADAYGYYWTDSNAPTPSVTYSWVDATGGTSAGFYYDYYDAYTSASIGFDFEFYGNTYSSVYISCNGYLQFGYAESDPYNSQVPDSDGPDNIVAAYWDGLMVYYPSYNYGQVYYQTLGTTPNQQFVVEFYQVSPSWENDLMTFEIILNETGEIWLQYQSMGVMDGSDATVGLENSDGTMGCLYSYNEATVSDGLAIMFDRGSLGFGDDQTGYAGWGGSDYYTLYVTNALTEADYFDITLDFSLLGWGYALYDSAWNPLADNDADGAPDTGYLASGGTFQLFAYVYVPASPTAPNETTVLAATSSLYPSLYDTVTLVTQTWVGVLGASHTSWGHDDDSDGDYDYLTLNLSVEMLTGAYMRVYTALYDGVGSFIYDMYTYANIPAGSQIVEVSYEGEYIYEPMGDGPYEFDIWLYDESWRMMDSDTYFTDAYLYTDFDPPAAMFLPPFSDYARDDDADGMYDFLVVNTTFEIFDEGYYGVTAELYHGSTWDYIGYSVSGSYFTPGVYDVQVLFISTMINESGLDYYCYVDLFLEFENWTTVDDYYSYETQWYVYSDFEGPDAEFVTPFGDLDEAVDTDSDWYFDYVEVSVPITCTETGLYDIDIHVWDPWGYDFATVTDTLSLTAGLDVVYIFQLDGGAIRDSGISGSYEILMYLFSDATGDQMDSEYYYTDYYYYYDFDLVGGYIDYVDDYGADTDSDGYYNEIVLYADIYPYSTGDFLVETYLDFYDSGWWTYFDTVSEVVHLEEGVWYQYEMVIHSSDFLPLGGDAYFYYYMSLEDEMGSVLYSTYSGYTGYYDYDYFDPIAGFEPPYDDYAVDEDSDGLYDYLVIELWVNASVSGYYDLEADVYGPWDYYDQFYFELYLEAGVPMEVLVEIPSAGVYEQQYSGYWYVYMYLYDHDTMYEYDDDYYSTGTYYYYTDFEPPGVEFDPPHMDYGADTDSDGYYDYLMFEIELDCYVAGTYTVYMDLYDYYDDFLTSLSSTQSMSIGNEDVDFAVEGWLIYYNGVSGYFSADLWVEDSDGNLLDYDYISYSYEYYYYWEFESPPAWFYPPHGDFAEDVDGDGLYDRLVVNASVEVSEPGDYVVVAYLYDDWWNPVQMASAAAFLDDGVHEVQVAFDAWPITLMSGNPYYVYLYLYDENENQMDYDGFYLNYYDRDDFDPATPTIESEWAYDAPVIDGAVDLDEWFGATPVDVGAADGMNEVQVMLYVLNDGEMLYILVDATGDTTETDGDMASVAFDSLNDELLTDGGDHQFVIEASSFGTFTEHLAYDDSYGYWVSHCSPFDPLLTDHDGLEGAAGFGPSPALAAEHRVYELSIPLALLGLAPGDTAGFGGLSEEAPLAMDAEDNSYSTWPVFFDDVPPLYMYGDLLLTEEPPLTTVTLDGTEGEAGWYVSDVEVTLAATGGTGGVANTSYSIDGAGWQTYEDPFVLDDGLHTVQYYSIDMGGNAEPVRSVQVMVDTVTPVTSASAEGTEGLDGWITSAATIDFDVSEASSGVAVTMYRLDGGDWTELSGSSMDVSEDGEHTVEFYSVDVAGHEEAASSIDFKVDATAPATGCAVDGSTVTLTPLDNASGVTITFYRIDGGDWMTYVEPFEVSGEGLHAVEYFSTDAAGNDETVGSVQVEGKVAGLLGVDTWIWAVIILVVVAAVVMMLFLFMRRRPGQPVQMVPGEAVVQQPMYEPPPPPQ